MKKLLLLGAFLAAGTVGLQDISTGHGGTYRGPGDTVPPGGGGGGGGGAPGTPGPAGPSAGGPGAPGTPAPSTPGGPAGTPAGGDRNPTTAGSGASGPDLTVWQFWWGFNREPYLNLRSKIHAGATQTGSDEFFLGRGQKDQAKDSLRPSEAVVRGTVVPALLKALATENSNDILTGAMIALAKIGDADDESGESAFEQEFKKFLANGNQEVAETAAVAMGILANEASIPTLVSLMKDDAEGHKLVKSTEVPYRTRAFAAYGLGLIGNRTSDNAVRQMIASHLIEILESPHFSTRDVKVAAMTSLGLTGVDVSDAQAEGDGNERHVVSRQAQIAYLSEYFSRDNQRANGKTRHWFVRAHAPVALARLLTDVKDEALRTQVVELLLEHCGQHSKEENEIQQSCAIALGMLGDADKGKEHATDEKIRAELVRLIKDGEEQTRRFSMIGLAQVGGRAGQGAEPYAGTEDCRKELVLQMSRGKTQLKPWAALALGVLGRSQLDSDQQLDTSAMLALRSATAENKRPTEAGAFMIALGMQRDLESREMIQEKMEYFQGSDDARGSAAVALGLMEARQAIAPIQEIIRKSKYRPDLLKQAAVGLGLLGDKDLVADLSTMLGEAKGLATQAAIASALGTIGDSRSIDPLVGMLENDKNLTDTARGFAAVALGIVCDKELLPWNAKISTNINYRASTVTLTSASQGTGILDIL